MRNAQLLDDQTDNKSSLASGLVMTGLKLFLVQENPFSACSNDA